ncbi:3'(2'),5'-bisphosphate nucleotidase [Plasticicumulans lactativorans]|uniref:3'(2'),5'-bisphosphate nucleotidase CysQ n=1 Tax=Plasticicumulans lactativorans TaxID=1133106 RepID=A0A4R2L1K2_9GAMM|nr:3'(2'),5'-bisphosphate nucleotidase CysQ [Plasticicumulans lactativorans]TCO80324.1 3'(2'),5'-bisphosphate nucleotidase [Plasticicumulans lactativorans]
MLVEPAALLEAVKTVAAEAAHRIMVVYESAFEVHTKDDESPLTAADRAAHDAIVAGLKALTPEVPVLSEEGSQLSFAERSRWARYWLVDPLDGTKEFIKRNGEFTVNIALIEQHRPVLGVVHVPVTGECYFAARGFGAWREAPGVAAEPIRVRRCNHTVHVVGSRSHGSPEMDVFISNLGDHAFVAVGSSLKFCRVAEGKADLYPRLGPTSEWDTAAAQCVVEQAGGRVVTVDGAPLAYNTKASLLNPHFLVYGDLGRDWLAYLEPTV